MPRDPIGSNNMQLLFLGVLQQIHYYRYEFKLPQYMLVPDIILYIYYVNFQMSCVQWWSVVALLLLSAHFERLGE